MILAKEREENILKLGESVSLCSNICRVGIKIIQKTRGEIMNKNIKRENAVIIYQGKNGAIELRGDFSHDTVWATQAQIVDLFSVDQSVVSRHIKNIFKDGEIVQKSNMQKMHIANSDKPVAFYSLDMILAVGYRTNSKIAIEFRKWATKTLRQYIVDGYAINKNRITKNYSQFLEAIKNIKHVLPEGANIDNAAVLELVSAFSDTWLSLDAYDKDELVTSGLSKKSIEITADQLTKALTDFKEELVEKNEATKIFGQERQRDAVAGIVGNVMQSFAGHSLYPTIEEKAAHFLYFMVKNHPFIDGNKRCGAYTFVWFLKKAGLLDISKITPAALTALTLLIAESDPKHKDKMTRVVMQLLKR